jgi:hypothetical protein
MLDETSLLRSREGIPSGPPQFTAIEGKLDPEVAIDEVAGRPIDQHLGDLADLSQCASGNRSDGLRRSADRHWVAPSLANENSCSMRDRSAYHPRDEAIRAAQHHAAVLAGILEDEFQASYRGP